MDGFGLAISMILSRQEKGNLSIDEALKIAQANSYVIKNAMASVEASKQRVDEAKGSIGPRVTTNYQYLRYGNEQTGNLGGAPIVFVPFDQNTWSTQLQLPIDIVGVFRSSKNAAAASVVATKFSLNASENDVRQNVRRSFLAVLRSKNLVEVAKQGRKNIEARLDQAQKQFNVKLLAKIDVDRLKAQIASANSDVINAENNYAISKQILNLAMARPIETEFEVSEWKESPAVNAELKSLVELGQYVRPEVKSIENTVVSLGAQKRFAEQGLLPSLNFALTNQQTLDPAGFNPQREVNTAVFQLSVPLFDSGVARARRRQTEQQIEQTQNNLMQLNLTISQEVRSARTNMTNALARLAAAKEQNTLSVEVARIARVRRDAGEGTTLEIIDAETQLVQSQNNLINAQYDYLSSYADLQRAVGTDDIQIGLDKIQAQVKKGEKK